MSTNFWDSVHALGDASRLGRKPFSGLDVDVPPHVADLLHVRLRELLDRISPRQRAVAYELGCGNGQNSAALSAMGFECTGVDSSRTAIELARRYWGECDDLHFLNCEVESLTETASVDLLFSVFGFLEFNPPEAAIRCLSALAPPGTLLVMNAHTCDSTGDRDCPFSRTRLDAGQESVVRYDCRSDWLSNELQRSGWAIDFMERMPGRAFVMARATDQEESSDHVRRT